MATTDQTTETQTAAKAKAPAKAPAKAAAKAPAKTTTAKAAAPKTAAAKPVVAKAAAAPQGKTGTQTGPQVTVTQTKSSAGRIKSQQQTLVGLGLGRIGKTRTLTATPSVQGMIDKVAHLIAVKQSA